MERLRTQSCTRMQIEWTDIAYQAKLRATPRSSSSRSVSSSCSLVHSAEYESWSLALAIILIAPMCLPFGCSARGACMDNNLITQIGFITLIGLAAKNASSCGVRQAAAEEGKDRFAGRGRGEPAASPADPHDSLVHLGVLPLARATDPEPRCARPSARRCSAHARRHVLRPLPDARVLVVLRRSVATR